MGKHRLETIYRWLKQHVPDVEYYPERKEIRAQIYYDKILIEATARDKKSYRYHVSINGNGYREFNTVAAVKLFIAKRYRQLFRDEIKLQKISRDKRVINTTVLLPFNIIVLLDHLVAMGKFPSRSEAIRYFLIRGLEASGIKVEDKEED